MQSVGGVMRALRLGLQTGESATARLSQVRVGGGTAT